MKEFELAQGVQVPSLEGIHQCYQKRQREQGMVALTINISVDVLETFIPTFIETLEAPCFFVLELPANEKEETQEGKTHTHVYYLDGLTVEELGQIYRRYQSFILHDGIGTFGFASHETGDELYISEYKVSHIFTLQPERYELLLESYQIPQEDTIKTVWDNFTQDTPGVSATIEVEGETIYTIPSELEERGMYLAEIRENAPH